MADRRRHIAVVTVGRSDFSILKPLCDLMLQMPGFSLSLWVGGAHFDPAGGNTVRDIEASGLPIAARIEADCFDHTPQGTARNMADQLAGFGAAGADAIASGNRPDLVIILGDRFEAITAAMAMIPLGLPVAHVSGGSITEGAIDDMFRHALTKLAALHFCDVAEFARRIHQMGEEPERIFAVGALGLDGIRALPRRSLSELRAEFGMDGLEPGYILATLHPETADPSATPKLVASLRDALKASGKQVVFTSPNADPGAGIILSAIQEMVGGAVYHVPNFGSKWFYSAMAHAGMIVGNSSSGIYEAASFALPVVDIGDRQSGRYHGANVIRCPAEVDAIQAAMAKAAAMAVELTTENVYGDGHAGERLLSVLERLDWDMLRRPKRFVPYDARFSGQRVVL